MCAVEAGRRGLRVAVLERAEKAGKKILISGGGRCNFTNLHCSPRNFLSDNPDFCRSALARYNPDDFWGWWQAQHSLSREAALSGSSARELFCDRSATDILGMLLEECAAVGVAFF